MAPNPPNPFRKAAKQQLKARVALDGPTGSGKTWTMLEWLTVLAQGGRFAVVDTEHGSASLYADRFDFDVLVWDPPYEPLKLAETIRQAQAAGYTALGLDSLSHFWEGEGGTLDMVDAAAQKAKGNTYAGWKVGTPALRHLIDTMLAADMHIVGTMRSKMEYILETNSKGQQAPKKVGMAPVMRAGVEYEFTLVGDLDLDHHITFSKSRCPALADVMVQPGRAGDAAEQFLAWLDAGEPMASATDVAEITRRMDALPKSSRSEAKRQLVAHLAVPSQLRADQVDAALTMVARFETGAGEQTSTPDGSGHRTDPEPVPVLAQAEGDAGVSPASPNATNDNDDTVPPAFTRDHLEQALMASNKTEAKVTIQARRLAESLGEPVPTSFAALEPGTLLDAVVAWLRSEAA